jgi:hypothetical protein
MQVMDPKTSSCRTARAKTFLKLPIKEMRLGSALKPNQQLNAGRFKAGIMSNGAEDDVFSRQLPQIDLRVYLSHYLAKVR